MDNLTTGDLTEYIKDLHGDTISESNEPSNNIITITDEEVFEKEQELKELISTVIIKLEDLYSKRSKKSYYDSLVYLESVNNLLI